MPSREIATPHGPARVHLRPAERARAALVLGHGAGGGIGAPDISAVADVGAAEGFDVVLVEQPYRVAGRRSPAPARQLDTAWRAVVEDLGERELHGLPLVAGGRSLGARVACRTAAESRAAAVLCLAFPLSPPRSGRSRLDELDAVAVPTLVVQGANDPFGMPPSRRGRIVAVVQGDHGLKADLSGVSEAVRAWLRALEL